MSGRPGARDAEILKSCCASWYADDLVRLVAGGDLHPGGPMLTRRLADLAGIGSGDRVLDVASGTGATARLLAAERGATVVGADLSSELVREANQRAGGGSGTVGAVRFVHGDAESLDVTPASFDAVLCECALCTFPDPSAAAAGFARALRPGGRVGVADVTVDPDRGPLAPALDDVFAHMACIAGARSVTSQVALLEHAGFVDVTVERWDDAALAFVRAIRDRIRLLGDALGDLVDLSRALELADLAAEAVEDHRLGYALVVGTRSDARSARGIVRSAPRPRR